MEIWKNDQTVQIDGFVINEQMICLFINDGRSLSLPISQFPSIAQLSHIDRRECQINDNNTALYWPALDFSIYLLDYLD